MSTAEDLTGRIFGRITVIERQGTRNNYALWFCQCSCGNELHVTSTRLRNGQQSCGCIRRGMKISNRSRKDLEGQRFGDLLVLEYAGADPWGKALWKCTCTCGNETTVTGSNLRRGITKACGCLRGKAVRLGRGHAAKNRVIRSYQIHATERGLVWRLSDEEFNTITALNCRYCDAEPQNTSSTKDTFGGFVYSGIDRIDSTEGYTVDNVVPCCKVCNWMKSNMTKTEFLNHIQRVYLHAVHV